MLAAATLPNYGLKSADERVKKMFPGAVHVENELLHRAQPQLEQLWVDRDDDDANALPQLAALLLDDAAAAESAETADAASRSARVRRSMVFCNTAAAAASCARGLAGALETAGLEGGRSALVLPYHKEVAKERACTRAPSPSRSVTLLGTLLPAARARPFATFLSLRMRCASFGASSSTPQVMPDAREAHLRAFAAGPGVVLPALAPESGASVVGDVAANGGMLRVLVCTDLASRGLDLGVVDHIVQFNFALNVVGGGWLADGCF